MKGAGGLLHPEWMRPGSFEGVKAKYCIISASQTTISHGNPGWVVLA